MSHLNAPIDIFLNLILTFNYIRSLETTLCDISGVKQFCVFLPLCQHTDIFLIWSFYDNDFVFSL